MKKNIILYKYVIILYKNAIIIKKGKVIFVKNIIIEYVGYGIYDARMSDFEIRGVGNSKLDALIDLLKRIQEEERDFSSVNCSINVAI